VLCHSYRDGFLGSASGVFSDEAKPMNPSLQTWHSPGRSAVATVGCATNA